MNLLKETIEAIKESGHAPEQIIFIGSQDTGHSCTWEEFQTLADVDYDHSYGSQKVATDLIVVFSDGTKMWRGEYDGSEWWEYSTPFVMPAQLKKISRLTTKTIGWDSLETCNT